MLSPHSLTLAHLLFIITRLVNVHSIICQCTCHLVCFTLLLNPCRFSLVHYSFHYFFVHFIISLFISSYANALGHLVCFTPFLPLLGFHHFVVHFIISLIISSFIVHFITYILGSLIFKHMLHLWVYTYKPWGFINSLFKWFLSF